MSRRLSGDHALLGLLALLWGASYLFLRIAVVEIPPLSLIALRVAGAAAVLLAVMALRRQRLPRGAASGASCWCRRCSIPSAPGRCWPGVSSMWGPGWRRC